jgi:hypothetical protein
MRDPPAMDRRGAGLLTDGVLGAALSAEDVALLERADAIRLLIERENPTVDERLDLLAWVVWPTEGLGIAFPANRGVVRERARALSGLPRG